MRGNKVKIGGFGGENEGKQGKNEGKIGGFGGGNEGK